MLVYRRFTGVQTLLKDVLSSRRQEIVLDEDDEDLQIHVTWETLMAFVNLPPPNVPPQSRNKGLIAGHIKGNQWLISP